MSVTLNTQLEELIFSSLIDDIEIATSDDNEAIVLIVSGDTTVFSATHTFPTRELSSSTTSAQSSNTAWSG